jgi:hypothetical protein
MIGTVTDPGKGKFTTGLMQTEDNSKHDMEANR